MIPKGEGIVITPLKAVDRTWGYSSAMVRGMKESGVTRREVAPPAATGRRPPPPPHVHVILPRLNFQCLLKIPRGGKLVLLMRSWFSLLNPVLIRCRRPVYSR